MKFKYVVICALAALCGSGAAAWEPLTTHIHTPWAEDVSADNVWNVYPRPTMERSRWMNLNGLWEYAITASRASRPEAFEGEILVPFAVESDLSGVGRRVGADQALWYSRTFAVPSAWKGEEILLNFGAVDWECDVWVNDVKVGSHRGGYSPFSLNITPALKARGENTLTVKVLDPTDAGWQPRGKQAVNPSGIWYTPVTGIWQTVWMEPVGESRITGLHTVADIDRLVLEVDVDACGRKAAIIEVKVTDGGEDVASARGLCGQRLTLDMPSDARLWSPDSPHLYDMEVTLYGADGRKLDTVKSYTALRKLSVARDSKGVMRLQLNNEPLFQFGPLDQGWWPDGLYTAPSHEAMAFDIRKTKEWGFNMIRKHVKVEPAVWYAECDRLGVLVWQDMPSGDRSPEWQMHSYFDGSERHRTPESEANFRREWKEIIDALRNHPCVAVWVPFNEAWGQFKSEAIAEWTTSSAPSRLLNPASGGNHSRTGDMLYIP
ncbi:MAG: beta-galactosidase, partial [Muribaculaceae bacterium]|nr:beta-galactosidase [Muribaculaceae bacterium]